MPGGSATLPESAGRQYHIGLSGPEVAESVVLVGDPDRADRVASRFDVLEVEGHHREYRSFTGRYRGLRVTVLATGIGPDNTEIALVELCRCVERPTVVRCGSCGAIQDHVRLGDLVLSTAALRLENTSLQYVEEGFPATSHPEVLLALAQAADEAGHAHHVGLTATAPGFYAAQGRDVPGFPPRRPRILEELARQGVLNVEMETSCLFTLAALRGFRAGAVCAVYAARSDDIFASETERQSAEARCIDTALEGLVIADALARARGGRPLWHPGIPTSP